MSLFPVTGGIGGLVTDGTSVYWGDSGGGSCTLYRTTLGSTSRTALASYGSGDAIGGIADVDSTYVYFALSTGNLLTSGIYRTPK